MNLDEGVLLLRIVMTDICNCLMAGSIQNALNAVGRFAVYPFGKDKENWLEDCRVQKPEIVLMEVAYHPGASIDDRLNAADRLRREIPDCRVILLCDENSAPELARKVAAAKRDGRIDGFVYSSVSESYLVALLDAI